MRDPYEVLGVSKTASAKDIKSAYRKLAKKHHPDQNPDDPKAKDKFAAANQAYEILGDEKSRAAFDRGEIDAEGKQTFRGFEGAAGGGDPFAGFRNAGPGGRGARYEFRSAGPGGGQGGFDASDIFSELFGQGFGPQGGRAGGGQKPAGADIAATMEVGLDEIATAGKVTAAFPDGRKIAVKLPAYVEDGQTIRLKGQGQPSPFGGPAGDALVTIRFRPDSKYRIEGRDLHMDLPVSLADAVRGAKVPVETLTGRLAVSIPAWSSSDKRLRLKGRGLPLKGGGHGDLYVQVRIMLPDDQRAELEALFARPVRG